MPIILALETSSEMASCALLKEGTLYWRESSGVRTHSQAILPLVQELLAEAGITLAQCDAIAFGAGPGSFTGVRTACGIAQGLAYGAGLPVLPLMTLDAMALACREQSGATDILAVLDARMGEVYWARYQAGQLVAGPALCAPGDLAALPGDAALTACGNGIAAYPEAFAGRAYSAAALTAIMPHARQIAQLGVAALAAGAAVQAGAAQPLYLRNKIAYTSAERQVINAAKAAA
ncbi:MAG TPA: tRNA (adenosine(37)-N6)-threonylcarbamoyltransferase complex dimerization subunit type 1 TsaB [Telluria sp.]|jgi:tRNA threonylcarbamoyladenosine biosynthesis protein TsaB